MKPHYHVKVREENRQDLLVWKEFLSSPDIYCRPFMEVRELSAVDINMFSDASGKIRYGAVCQNSWLCGKWSQQFLKEDPNIECLELYAWVAGVLSWIDRFKNRRVCLFSDNISVVHMINNTSSRCEHCMILLHMFVLHCLKHNVKVFAKYVNTKDNGLSDALSHDDMARFRKLGPHIEKFPTKTPDALQPFQKVWCKSYQ